MSITLANIWNLFVKCVNLVLEGIVAIIRIYFYLFFTAFATLFFLGVLFFFAKIAFMILGALL